MTDTDQISELRRRIAQLEYENQRLREKVEPIFGPDNPCFDPAKFQRIFQVRLMLFMLPVYLGAMLFVPLAMKYRTSLPTLTIGGVQILDFAGIGTRHPGIGFGVVAFGGLGVGIIGFGGLGVGVIALGGGSLGLVAIGGGSVGLIAIGGGALGWISVGGGACGRYALAMRGYGKYVLALNRQDDEAIELFCRFVPALRATVTRPMPVIVPDKP